MFLLLLRVRQPPVVKPDWRSQFGQPSFARHPKLTQETTVYDELKRRFTTNCSAVIGQANLANPVWRIYPLTELIILAPSVLRSKRTCVPFTFSVNRHDFPIDCVVLPNYPLITENTDGWALQIGSWGGTRTSCMVCWKWATWTTPATSFYAFQTTMYWIQMPF